MPFKSQAKGIKIFQGITRTTLKMVVLIPISTFFKSLASNELGILTGSQTNLPTNAC